MNQYSKRKDANHEEIKAYFIKSGCDDLIDLYKVGGGVPDLWVFVNGIEYWVEIKYKTGKQTEQQVRFQKNHPKLRYIIVRNTSDVDRLFASESRKLSEAT